MVKHSRNITRKRKIRRKSLNRKSGGFGPASWNSSMVNPYINHPQNNYINDPSYPSIGGISARNINGGKRYRRRTYKNKNLKKLKKGGTYAGVPLGTGPPVSNWPFFSTVSSAGALSSQSMFTGNGLPISSEVSDNRNYVPALA